VNILCPRVISICGNSFVGENNEIVIRGTLNGKENRLKIDDNPRMYIEKKEKFIGRFLIIDYFFHIFTKDEEVELNMDSFGEEYFNDFINNFIYKDINEIDNETLDKISLEHEYNYTIIESEDDLW